MTATAIPTDRLPETVNQAAHGLNKNDLAIFGGLFAGAMVAEGAFRNEGHGVKNNVQPGMAG